MSIFHHSYTSFPCSAWERTISNALRCPVRYCLLQFAILILPAFCLAESPQAVPVDGQQFHAELIAADAKWQLTFTNGKTIPAADLVRWGQCPEQGRAGCLVLADGSLLTAEVVAADKDQITVDSDLFGTLKLPLESLAGIVFRTPSDRQQHDAILDRLIEAIGESDRLMLDNGDQLTGLVESIAADTITIKTDVGSIEIKTDRITAICFNPALRRKPTAAKNHDRAWAAFADGSRLLATQLLIEGNSLKITAAGQTLSAARSSLVFLQPLTGRAIYLSDLKPFDYSQTPYLKIPWPYRLDRNVTGTMLRSAGRLHLKGIGLHSAAKLIYQLSPRPLREGQNQNSPGPVEAGRNIVSPRPLGEGPGVRAARRFDASIAIDDSTAGRGSVLFRVLVDDKERFTSPILRGGDAPVPVSVDIDGAKKLELIVDYADRADVLDHANWLDARITQ